MQNEKNQTKSLGEESSEVSVQIGLKPWLIIINPGTDNECIYAEFDSFLHAMDYRESKMKHFDLDYVDVAKKKPDGKITFEY